MEVTRRPTPMRGKSQPARSDVLGYPQLTVADHPLVDVLMTELRNIQTPAPAFAAAIDELTRFLLWQTLTDLPTEPVEVIGHSGTAISGAHLGSGLAGLIILRAGLGMANPMRTLLPAVPIYQVGVRRSEETLLPEVYYVNLPADGTGIRHMLLLDPMLATGGSAVATVQKAREIYDGPITFLGLIGAALGVEQLVQADPTIQIRLAALDDGLDDHGFIVPGLGDAGDRLFSTG